MIQVSLLPPPCDEFTIVEFFFMATLVRPPLVTNIFLPDKINGRKSKCLGSILLPMSVGEVDNFISGCATKFLGLFLIFC